MSTAVSTLQALLRIPTVSTRNPDDWDHAAFEAFHAALREHFPLLHAHLELTRIGDYGLLFRWPGESAERPVVLMAHIDVVPVEGGEWTHPPFGAVVEGGVIWGRGTLDDKSSLVAICLAVEDLLAGGFRPAQDVWLSFGCNEEVAGDAAPLAVAHLRDRGVEPWFVLDEGGAVAYDAFPGVTEPIAVIGVTEKGITSLELRVEGRGGHASTPAKLGPTARLARAITRLDRSAMRASIPQATVELFRRAAPLAKQPMRSALMTAARFRPLLTRLLLAAGPESAAMVRSTFAVTTLTGSPSLNVVAASATAGVNIRIMIGDTVESVVAHVRKVIADDQVRIRILDAGEPSPASPIDDAFDLLEATTAKHFPEAVTAPYVMMAATDARHFTAICRRVYRFTPFAMTKKQREAIHSYDEHLRVDAFLKGVDWYRSLLESLPFPGGGAGASPRA
ncbi:M20/M25/M40 family metallo-hydrolase [Actinoplanes sp. NBC_00393]|uniref:M20/M25/M40 family metallo-hydrolase n=1 Tax=Actinoplanes sp. NBC_00393 TaxID=2975953 RepID=UPI002E215654